MRQSLSNQQDYLASIVVELPESMLNRLSVVLEHNPRLDQDTAIQAAIAFYLQHIEKAAQEAA